MGRKRLEDYLEDRGERFAKTKQQIMLRFIRNRVRHNQGFPSTEDLRIYMAWGSKSSVLNCLHKMEAGGFLQSIKKGRNRAWILLHNRRAPMKRVLRPRQHQQADGGP